MSAGDINKLAAEWARKIRALKDPDSNAGEQPAADAPPAIAETAELSTRPTARTENLYRMGKRKLELLAKEAPDDVDVERPKTRGDCLSMERPCPFVGCRYHLYMSVSSKGSITFEYPDLEVWELIDTCALDVAEETEETDGPTGNGEGSGVTLERVGLILNLTRERVRQIEVSALTKLRRRAKILREFVDGDARAAIRTHQTDDDEDEEVDDEDDQLEPP